jgi:hypothetical protein
MTVRMEVPLIRSQDNALFIVLEGSAVEFKISEAQARAMARLEEEAGCDVSAGPR